MAKYSWDDWRKELEGIPIRFRHFYSDLEDAFKKNFPTEVFGGGPRIELSENADSYYLDVELPGAKREEIKLTVSSNAVAIRGSRARTYDTASRTILGSERNLGSFDRTVQLHSSIDEDRVTAVLADGVLSLSLPKSDVQAQKERDVAIG